MIEILIAEDDTLTRMGLSSMLKASDKNFKVVCEVDNGKAALDFAKVSQPDVIITDINMPILNGIELIKAAKKLDIKSKFIILSAHDEFNFVRDALRLGADDYVLKFELEEQKLTKLICKLATTDQCKNLRNQNNLNAKSDGLSFNQNENEDSSLIQDDGVSFQKELKDLDTAFHSQDMNAIELGLQNIVAKAQQNINIPVKVLHGLCYTIIHLTDRFLSKNSYLNSDWSRSKALEILIKKCRSYNDYVRYIIELKQNICAIINSDVSYKIAILKTKQYIENHLTEKIAIKNISCEVHLNSAYLSRLFHQETGCTLTDYITKRRLEQAKTLLATTEETIGEISEKTGFNNANYFCRIFKKETGNSPIGYRKLIRQKENDVYR